MNPLSQQSDKDANPRRISTRRTKAQATSQMARISTAQGGQRRRLQTEFGLYGHYNPLFQLSVDLFRYMYSVGIPKTYM